MLTLAFLCEAVQSFHIIEMNPTSLQTNNKSMRYSFSQTQDFTSQSYANISRSSSHFHSVCKENRWICPSVFTCAVSWSNILKYKPGLFFPQSLWCNYQTVNGLLLEWSRDDSGFRGIVNKRSVKNARSTFVCTVHTAGFILHLHTCLLSQYPECRRRFDTGHAL